MEELTENKKNYSDVVVALDLGSRNVRGMIGRKNETGKLDVWYSDIEESDGIEKGIVTNVETVAGVIKNLILKMRNVLNSRLNEKDGPRYFYDIKNVYVGLNAKTIHGDVNEISRCFGSEPISVADMQEIERQNRLMPLEADRKIVDVVPFEYILDGESLVENPVGCICTNLRARFLNVHAEKKVEDNIRKCFDIINNSGCKDPNLNVNCQPIFVLHSRHISDAVLSPEQKEVGCMLLDFGAQTISLSIYHEQKLRFVHVFNFGSDLITKDIMQLQLPGKVAEKLKKNFGSPMPSLTTPIIVDMQDGRQVDTIELSGIIQARMREFLNRINTAIDLSGYRSVLDSIVIIGGGAKMGHMIEFIEAETGISTRFGDIRVLSEGSAKESDITNASVVGIMASAVEGSVSCREIEEPNAPAQPEDKGNAKGNKGKGKDKEKRHIFQSLFSFMDEQTEKFFNN